MIQNLMKQMSQQLTQNAGIGQGQSQFGGAGEGGGADTFDLNSLLGGGGLGGGRVGGYNGGGQSNTDTITLNSFQTNSKYNGGQRMGTQNS